MIIIQFEINKLGGSPIHHGLSFSLKSFWAPRPGPSRSCRELSCATLRWTSQRPSQPGPCSSPTTTLCTVCLSQCGLISFRSGALCALLNRCHCTSLAQFCLLFAQVYWTYQHTNLEQRLRQCPSTVALRGVPRQIWSGWTRSERHLSEGLPWWDHLQRRLSCMLPSCARKYWQRRASSFTSRCRIQSSRTSCAFWTPFLPQISIN